MTLSVPWLFFLLVISKGTLSQVAANPLWTEDQGPNCDQLKALWDVLSRSVQISQITNEIPVLPRELFDYINPHQTPKLSKKERHLRISHRPRLQHLFPSGEDYTLRNNLISNQQTMDQNFLSNPLIFPEVSRDIEILPSIRETQGFFGQFDPVRAYQPAPRPFITLDNANSMGFDPSIESETRKTADDEAFFEPQWGSAEEVGSFGRFVDFDDVPLHSAKTRAPKEPLNMPLPMSASTQSKSLLEKCTEVYNRECSRTEQCACQEWSKLHCVQGRCFVKDDLNNSNKKELVIWHDGPLPRSELGLVSRLKRRRRDRSILM